MIEAVCLGNWNVSKVTDMNVMFSYSGFFNQDIGDWDVSNVTIMSSMFFNAQSFNQDIGSWDVSKVTGMSSMFEGAMSFNQNLSRWCVEDISSEPYNFAYNSGLPESKKPVWGTCPEPVSNEPNEEVPVNFALQQNYPNPFNPSTNIQFGVPETAQITLTVFNSLGQQVEVLVSGIRRAGVHQVSFDASDLASGIYFYRLTTPKKVFTEKMLLVK